MKNKTLVSIIIPVYNEEKNILECIHSIKRQTYKNFQIIIVDDGSTDCTLEKIPLDKKIQVYRSSHKGPGYSRNIAAKSSKGNILIFIDGDMKLDKNYIKEIIKPIIKHKNTATVHAKEYNANPENIWSFCWNINNDFPKNIRMNELSNKNSVIRAIKKSDFLKLSGYNPKLGYQDDIIKGINKLVIKHVKKAIAYHYNPDNLKDVYFQARWIGRSPSLRLNIINLRKYSIINSINISIIKILHGSPIIFLIFKIIFDIGIVSGMFSKKTISNYAK